MKTFEANWVDFLVFTVIGVLFGVAWMGSYPPEVPMCEPVFDPPLIWETPA